MTKTALKHEQMSYLIQTHYRLLAQNASTRKLKRERATSAAFGLLCFALIVAIACSL